MFIHYINVDSLSLVNCLVLSLFIFLLGIFGILYNRKNIVLTLVFLEVLFFSISCNFIFYGFFLNNPIGYVYAILIITIAAAETVLGLSLLVVIFRINHRISFDLIISLRG